MCSKRALWIGDALVLFLITYIGFVTHGTQGYIGRWLLTAVLTLVAWYLAAVPVGLMDPEKAARKTGWLYVLWATLLSAPLALAARALLLHRAIPPTFPPAAAAFNGLAMLLWRGLFALRCKSS